MSGRRAAKRKPSPIEPLLDGFRPVTGADVADVNPAMLARHLEMLTGQVRDLHQAVLTTLIPGVKTVNDQLVEVQRTTAQGLRQLHDRIDALDKRQLATEADIIRRVGRLERSHAALKREVAALKPRPPARRRSGRK